MLCMRLKAKSKSEVRCFHCSRSSLPEHVSEPTPMLTEISHASPVLVCQTPPQSLPLFTSGMTEWSASRRASTAAQVWALVTASAQWEGKSGVVKAPTESRLGSSLVSTTDSTADDYKYWSSCSRRCPRIVYSTWLPGLDSSIAITSTGPRNFFCV
jgi:hypothetical protein